MHFWIDKRSQTCGFDNRRYGVPASALVSGVRRKKTLLTPVHRFRAIENGSVSQPQRRQYQQPASQQRPPINGESNSCQTMALLGDSSDRRIQSAGSSATPETEVLPYLDAPLGAALDRGHHGQFMTLGNITKYGMWASFGLTTVSVAATKFYADHQGIFEILFLCTVGMLSAGLLVSCAITACKKSPSPHFIGIQGSMESPPQQATTTELSVPEVMTERDAIIPLVTTSLYQQRISGPLEAEQQPPPPYDIAILLPAKDPMSPDYPPPSYENAVR